MLSGAIWHQDQDIKKKIHLLRFNVYSRNILNNTTLWYIYGNSFFSKDKFSISIRFYELIQQIVNMNITSFGKRVYVNKKKIVCNFNKQLM